jgi:hypothetical protein
VDEYSNYSKAFLRSKEAIRACSRLSSMFVSSLAAPPRKQAADCDMHASSGVSVASASRASATTSFDSRLEEHVINDEETYIRMIARLDFEHTEIDFLYGKQGMGGRGGKRELQEQKGEGRLWHEIAVKMLQRDVAVLVEMWRLQQALERQSVIVCHDPIVLPQPKTSK